ncbi:MAG: response regulator transcription factor [Lachnospiraceae bacterium]|nr:response regulator transcription factor [Lachnospiraceae bacterium]
MPKKPYSVMIVEDQPMARKLFEMIVEQDEGYELKYSVESASVAHMYCDKETPDLVIMDVIMSDRSNGLDAAERIKKSHPDVKIVITTSMPEVSFIERAKQAGVDSFWYKGAEPAEILDVMNRTMAGQSIYPDTTPAVNLGEIDSTELTGAELEVLRELTKGASNVEIAEILCISPTTVRTHISNMLSKTGFANRTELAIKARLSGLVIGE